MFKKFTRRWSLAIMHFSAFYTPRNHSNFFFLYRHFFRSFALLVECLTDQNISIPFVTNFSLSFIFFFLSRINFSSFSLSLSRSHDVRCEYPKCVIALCLHSDAAVWLLLLLLNKYISLFYLLTSMGVFHHTHKFLFIIIIIILFFWLLHCVVLFYDISFALNIYMYICM